MGKNPSTPPPMDEQPLQGIEYQKDALGRITYLSTGCLRIAKDQTSECVVQEKLAHLQLVEGMREAAFQRQEQVRLDAIAQHAADQKLQVEREAQARAQAIAAVPEVERRANEIRRIKRNLAGYQRMLGNENEIASVSGVTDMRMRYNYGMLIVQGRRALASEYAAYRRAGGRKALSAL